VPSSIAMDAYNAPLFSWLVRERRLVALFDYENRDGIFEQVHRSYRFCTLTINGRFRLSEIYDFCFFAHSVLDIHDPRRRVSLTPNEIALFSPNTLAPPMLLGSADLELTRKVYKQFGVMVNKTKEITNHWGVSIQRMLSLSDPGDLFRREDEISSDSFSHWQRLYSGKVIHHYNHRFASWNGSAWKDSSSDTLERPSYVVQTEYYVKDEEVTKRAKGKNPSKWLVGYRDVCRATDERTAIASIIPLVGCDTHCRNLYFEEANTIKISKLAVVLVHKRLQMTTTYL